MYIEVEDLTADLAVAENNYYIAQTAETYNELRRISKLLAHKLLVQKALQGSTLASVELAKRNPLNPDLGTDKFEDIAKYNDVSLEFLEAAEKKLSLCRQTHGTDNAQEILELWKKGRITHSECDKMLQIIGKKQQIELAAKEQVSRADIFLEISGKVDEAI